MSLALGVSPRDGESLVITVTGSELSQYTNYSTVYPGRKQAKQERRKSNQKVMNQQMSESLYSPYKILTFSTIEWTPARWRCMKIESLSSQCWCLLLFESPVVSKGQVSCTQDNTLSPYSTSDLNVSGRIGLNL